MPKKSPSKTKKLVRYENPAQAGVRACENHVEQSANPYPKGTQAHQKWDEAWVEQKWGGIEY